MMENRYDKYKDSGIAWIGEIPEHWKVAKIKSFYNVILGKMVERNNDSNTGDENYLCAANIKWNGVDTEINKKMYFSDIEKEKYLLQYNDVLIMEGGMAGTACLYKNEFSPCYVQNSVNVCRAKKDFNNKFLYYWMYVPYYNGYIDAICNKATIRHYTKEKVQNTPILISSLVEQQSIATYLDQKCGEIDELITLQEEMITKLQSYKQSVITEAVTKGLDKNVPLKDSGIEWIGEIPEHWEVVDLRHLCKKITDGSHFSPQITDEGGFYITVSNVFDDKIHFENAHKISIKDFNTLITNGCQPPIGSVLLTKDGTVGRTTVVTDNNFVVLSSLAILSLKSNILAEYVKYVLDSETLQEQMKLLMAGSALRRITLNKIYTLKMIYAPSSFEQQAIADYLDQKCSEIDELISIKQQKIEKLKEYKKSLIFECVTGKRKVS